MSLRVKGADGKVGLVDGVEQGGIGDDLGDAGAGGPGDLLDDGIAFRMNGGGVERLLAAADAQEAGGLLEGFAPTPGTFLSWVREVKRAVPVAELDDVQGGALGNAGDVAEQRPGGGVEIDANLVDAAFNGGFERLLELTLVDIMLVLADADGLRVDLDELGERILQPARDGDGPADGEVEVGKLLPRDFAGGIDGGSGFGDHDLEDRRQAVFGEEVTHKRVGLA